MLYINSKENKTYKRIKKLKQKKYRDEEKLFLAEGRKFLDFSKEPCYIFINEEYDYSSLNLEKFSCEKIVLSNLLFKELSSQENSQGVILVYDNKEHSLNEIENQVVILDMVGDPGNLGTIIRTLDASGYKDIILTRGSVDAYNEKTIRSTMGSIFNVRIYYLDDDTMLEFLKANNYKLIVTALEKDSIPYTEMKLEERNAFIFGNEGNGVRKELINLAHEKVIIPIYGSAESLNVGIAVGIIAYKAKELCEKSYE